MKNEIITWGYSKGVRGFWEWHKGHVRFRKAERFQLAGNRLQIIKDIEPFKNVAVDGGYVGGRKQKRDMMRAHNLIEAGDIRADKPISKPYDARKHQERVVQSLKQALHQHGHGD